MSNMSNIRDGSPVTDRGTLGTNGGTGDEALRLDGNAAAGLLEEILPFEMTTAQST